MTTKAQIIEEMDMDSGTKNILDLYQEFTPTTWVDDPLNDFNANLQHAAFGVQAEAGEIAGAYQKYYRGDYDEEELKERLKGEIGGLMYYVAQLCSIEGFRLTNILVQNRDILIDRQNRGVIKGDGDVR